MGGNFPCALKTIFKPLTCSYAQGRFNSGSKVAQSTKNIINKILPKCTNTTALLASNNMHATHFLSNVNLPFSDSRMICFETSIRSCSPSGWTIDLFRCSK